MTYGEITESYIRSDCYDGKGREIGYIVGFRDNGEDFRAYVQMARVWRDPAQQVVCKPGGCDPLGLRNGSRSHRQDRNLMAHNRAP